MAAMNLVEARRLWALMIAVSMAVPAAHGVWLNLPSSGHKCVSEELQKNVVVMADYFSFYGDEDNYNGTVTPAISIKVSSPFGNELHHKENVSYGRIAFTTNEPGSYLTCFTLDSSHRNGKTVTVGFDWRTGIAAKDWDSVAKKEKIEGLDLEFKKLEEAAKAIQKNMNRLMIRAFEARRESDTTNSRIARYSMMSLGLCIVVSVLQLWYLRRYFQKKKLI